MAPLTRKGFLARTSASIAAFGMMLGVPGLTAVGTSSEAPAADAAVGEFSEPMVAHISNFATGEVSLLIGTKEIVVQDAQLVARLVQAVR